MTAAREAAAAPQQVDPGCSSTSAIPRPEARADPQNSPDKPAIPACQSARGRCVMVVLHRPSSNCDRPEIFGRWRWGYAPEEKPMKKTLAVALGATLLAGVAAQAAPIISGAGAPAPAPIYQ